MKKRIPWNKGKTGVYSKKTRRKWSLARKGKKYAPGRVSGMKEKLEEAIRLIGAFIEAISERKERWEYVSTDKDKQVNLFLDAIITDLGNLKKTLEG